MWSSLKRPPWGDVGQRSPCCDTKGPSLFKLPIPMNHSPTTAPSFLKKKHPRPPKIRSKSNKNVHKENSFLLTSCFCLLANSERVKSTNTKSKETTALQCFFWGVQRSGRGKCPIVWDNKDQPTTTWFLLVDTAQRWNRDAFTKKTFCQNSVHFNDLPRQLHWWDFKRIKN